MAKKIDPDDLRLWWLNTRDVTPLHKDIPDPDLSKKRRTVKEVETIIQPSKPASRLSHPSAPFQQKRRSRLRKQVIEAELDLHGYTLDQAWDALNSFLKHARNRGKRTVLVITGKGSMISNQTLRVQVPRWLQEKPFSSYILGYQQSLQHDGGAGAYYVYLKKIK